MPILFLKTGLFALDPIYGPVVACKEGGRANYLTSAHEQQLIDAGWAVAEVIGNTAPKDIVADDVAPWLEQGWTNKRPDAKKRLEQWGKYTLGIDIDRRKSVKNIIKQLKAAQND